MTFKERKELEKETVRLSDETYELLENENEIAKDLWDLCLSSDNWLSAGNKLEDYQDKEYELAIQYEEENLKAKKEFFELFINCVKKYNK